MIKPGNSEDPSRPDCCISHEGSPGERCVKPASKIMWSHKVKSTCQQVTREGRELPLHCLPVSGNEGRQERKSQNTEGL